MLQMRATIIVEHDREASIGDASFFSPVAPVELRFLQTLYAYGFVLNQGPYREYPQMPARDGAGPGCQRRLS